MVATARSQEPRTKSFAKWRPTRREDAHCDVMDSPTSALMSTARHRPNRLLLIVAVDALATGRCLRHVDGGANVHEHQRRRLSWPGVAGCRRFAESVSGDTRSIG